MLVLNRGYLPFGTFGQLVLENGAKFATVERPWLNNQPGRSCFPEGEYTLRLRSSPVVQRTSKGKYPKGFEVSNIPGRSLCMLHVANFPTDVEGCIGIGKEIVVIGGTLAVNNSIASFTELMEYLLLRDTWTLRVQGLSARL